MAKPAYTLSPTFKQVLIMAMGDEFEPQSIHAYQLTDLAETCSIDKELVARLLTGLADKVLQQLTDQGSGSALINQLKQQPFITAGDLEYFQALRDNIVARTNYLKAQTAEIPFIRV